MTVHFSLQSSLLQFDMLFSSKVKGLLIVGYVFMTRLSPWEGHSFMNYSRPSFVWKFLVFWPTF